MKNYVINEVNNNQQKVVLEKLITAEEKNISEINPRCIRNRSIPSWHKKLKCQHLNFMQEALASERRFEE
jgi:hypothetical protein